MVEVITHYGMDTLGCETVVIAVFPPGQLKQAKLDPHWWSKDHLHNFQYHRITRFYDQSQEKWRYISKCEGTAEENADDSLKLGLLVQETFKRLREEEETANRRRFYWKYL